MGPRTVPTSSRVSRAGSPAASAWEAQSGRSIGNRAMTSRARIRLPSLTFPLPLQYSRQTLAVVELDDAAARRHPDRVADLGDRAAEGGDVDREDRHVLQRL